MALSGQKIAFLTALFDPRNRTDIDAARAADVPHRTACRWLVDPEFKQAMVAAQDKIIDELTARSLGTVQAALDVKLQIMADKTNPPSVRLRAADSVTDAALRLVEMQREREMIERITAIEQTLLGVDNA